MDPSFEDVRRDLGPDFGAATGWGVSWADLDLDTDLDLVLANGGIPVTDLAGDAEPVQAFANLAAPGSATRFEDVGAAAGLAEVGPLLARGSAAATSTTTATSTSPWPPSAARSCLLENRAATGNWLEVELDGFHPGAVITVSLPDGREVTRRAAGGEQLPVVGGSPRATSGWARRPRWASSSSPGPTARSRPWTTSAANQILVVEPPA